MKNFLYLPYEDCFLVTDHIKRVFIRSGTFNEEDGFCYYISIELQGDNEEYFYDSYEKEVIARTTMYNIFNGFNTRL